MKKTTAAILMMLGLALAGFGSAGFAARSSASGAADSTTAKSSLCTRAHPCPNPRCAETGFGRDDCFDTTTPQTTTTGSTSTATTTSPGATTTGPVATTGSTTTGAFVPPTTPPVGTTTTGTTTTTAGATTTTVTPGTGGSFRPPKVPRPRPPLASGPAQLPFTGAATPRLLLLGFVLFGLGLLLLFFARNKGAAVPVTTTPRTTGARARTFPTDGSNARAERSLGYRVFVPGRGAFASFVDAEQSLLDHRWARAGCPRLGAPGHRRSDDG